MHFTKKHLMGAIGQLVAASAFAAVPAEEAKQLGTTLTAFGAVKAGNKEGTIPEYTGGLASVPKNLPFKQGSGVWPNPYDDEKPVLRIDAKNVDQHSDKLNEGTKYLIKKYPTYYVNIYPTHRSTAYPDWVLKNSARNAVKCQTLNNYLGLEEGCRGGIPFPIPKNGYEVMWNQTLRYAGDGAFTTKGARSWMVDASGNKTMTSQIRSYTEKPYWQVELKDRDPNMYTRLYAVTDAPARKAGEATGYNDYLNPSSGRKAWSYSPGQRRVKLAPEFNYDTPVSTTGGVMLYDEIFLFSGKMDRFDFKLVGKKEMYIPANNYKMMFECKSDTSVQTRHMNPECERWELHRVWVVEATLKPGMRHVYSKRTYYFDEDNYSGVFDAWDANGQLYRSAVQYSSQLYDVEVPYAPKFVIYDYIKGMFSLQSDAADGGGYSYIKGLPERELTPDAIAGAGIR